MNQYERASRIVWGVVGALGLGVAFAGEPPLIQNVVVCFGLFLFGLLFVFFFLFVFLFFFVFTSGEGSLDIGRAEEGTITLT